MLGYVCMMKELLGFRAMVADGRKNNDWKSRFTIESAISVAQKNFFLFVECI